MEPNKISFGADRYYKAIKKSKIICVDFDNTVCLDEWPYVGPIIPGAIEVLKALENGGHKLILYTQRTTHYPICCKELYEYSNNSMSEVDILTPAINVFKENGINLFDVNANSLWENETKDNSRKVFMDYLIDDHAVGTTRYRCKNSHGELCKFVNWWEIDNFCLEEKLYGTPVFNMPHMEFYMKYVLNFYDNIMCKVS